MNATATIENPLHEFGIGPDDLDMETLVTWGLWGLTAVSAVALVSGIGSGVGAAGLSLAASLGVGARVAAKKVATTAIKNAAKNAAKAGKPTPAKAAQQTADKADDVVRARSKTAARKGEYIEPKRKVKGREDHAPKPASTASQRTAKKPKTNEKPKAAAKRKKEQENPKAATKRRRNDDDQRPRGAGAKRRRKPKRGRNLRRLGLGMANMIKRMLAGAGLLAAWSAMNGLDSKPHSALKAGKFGRPTDTEQMQSAANRDITFKTASELEQETKAKDTEEESEESAESKGSENRKPKEGMGASA